MSGLVGFYSKKLGTKKTLQAMDEAQLHRGSVAGATFYNKPAAFAHRRETSEDVLHGPQPLTVADSDITVAFDGVIFNDAELRAELEAEGHTFGGTTDTEVVAAVYARFGVKGFNKLEGMFAVALWDAVKETLVIARDHLGIKPVYLAKLSDKEIFFASEIKSLLAAGVFEAAPNDRVIYRYLNFRVHDDGRETFFDSVERLLPGEALEINADGVKSTVFSTLRSDLEELAAEQGADYTPEAAVKFRELLTGSVRRRLRGDAKIGTMLSGGLDSSTIVALVDQIMVEEPENAKALGEKQVSFSAVFPGQINDEEEYIDAMLQKIAGRVDSRKLKPSVTDLANDLIDFVRTQEEPVISTGPFTQYRVMKEASGKVEVLLEGQGADETLAGYTPYFGVYLRELKRDGRKADMYKEVLKTSDIFAHYARINLMGKVKGKKNRSMQDLLNQEYVAEFKDERLEIVQDDIKLRLVEDTFHNSLPCLLRYADRNGARFGLEDRVPFLDESLLRYIFSLNSEAIINESWNKRIMRDATQNLLPKKINRRRKKIGFTAPENDWFEGMKDEFFELFKSKKFATRPYFNPSGVIAEWEGFVKGQNDQNTMTFWRIINVELWLREFIDKKEDTTVKLEAPPKSDFVPNPTKNLDIEVDGKTYRRYSLRTEKVKRDDDLHEFIGSRLQQFVDAAKAEDPQVKWWEKPWDLYVSETIVSIIQGRSYFLWEIEPSWWARTLSKRVVKTSYGIGIGSPWTMELAIREAGLPKILMASAASVAGKLVGKSGVFYNIVGDGVRAIDGPADYCVYPSNVSAKLAPKDSDGVAAALSALVRQKFGPEITKNFGGTIIMDANDIGRNIMGKDVATPDKTLEEIFADNPLGQGGEQTPVAVVTVMD